jgi:thioredoxin-like negative regulator of GroEL
MAQVPLYRVLRLEPLVYIFVSLGGYWPTEYNYLRYYWYGCHPYYWYGYSPVPYEVAGDTYNYYTYNYYNNEPASSAPSSTMEGIKPVDENTFADVREKLAAQAAKEPAPETLADKRFEEAVNAFEAGTYDVAAAKFAEAMELAPEDTIIPFAYAQALFANKQYTQAAEILRTAIVKTSPQKEGVFYPRGLYADDDTLFNQIDKLAEEAELYSFDGDLQLLLGYQLLGIGETEKAVEPLQQASKDSKNAATAKILLDLLEKMKTQDVENTNQ